MGFQFDVSIGFCGIAIYSMWNKGKQRPILVKKGEDVHIDDFGGEGTGLKSMKQINWTPNEMIEFTVTGFHIPWNNSWNVECIIKTGNDVHVMATFSRPGESMHEDFSFQSFIEDFQRSPTANGCLYKRSAQILHPQVHYSEYGDEKVLNFETATFMKDQNFGQNFCADWSCAEMRNSGLLLTTGGGRLGRTKNFCEHNKVLIFNNFAAKSNSSPFTKICRKKIKG